MAQHLAGDSLPLFTVVIPSKNRAEYLYHTLRTCMMQNYGRLEVLVSDDGSTENNREVVEEASSIDPRIRFVSLTEGAGMRDNFEFALRQVQPGFVIALGGDDGLLPNGIEGMWELLKGTGTDLLTWSAPIYSYPNVNGSTAQLALPHPRSTRVIESAAFLRRQTKRLHYLSDVESPMFYVKGVASTELIARVRDRTPDGRFYSCPTPDGYSGIVLAGEVPRYVFSGRPFSIFGATCGSQGRAYMSNDEQSKRVSELFLQSASSRPMHRDLASQPYSPLITLMTVDYLQTARDLSGWPGTVPRINYRQVLVNALNELAHGLYGEERICRELSILNAIAQYHGLGAFFRERVRRAHRSPTRSHFNGAGVNARLLFLDGGEYELQNIVEAAYAAKYIHQAYSSLNPKALLQSIMNSIRYRFSAMGAGAPFPSEAEWNSILGPWATSL